MAGSVNRVVLVGRLGGDPELKRINGNVACGFSVATDESWTDKQGQKQSRVEWHSVVTWGKLAEICGEYLEKGRQVYVEGSLRTNEYEKDGVKRYSTKVTAREVVFLGGMDKQQRPSKQQYKGGTSTAKHRDTPEADDEKVW